jgi:DNA polymerase-4
MRSLPVGKIWGAGNKTQEQFRKYGFKTCEDIHRLTLGNLKSIFGASFGLFLYRAVRGEAASDWKSAAFDDDERGSHSMSAERTFPYDLYDEFTIETALFDLCETLMFRLLDKNWQSRTVAIKIRYEDFSNESARETFPNPVGSINELFDHLSALFRRKYQEPKVHGRGVRLIGAGLLNLETENTPIQGELFDTTNEKERAEQALEKYILEINKKFPNAALRKGRSLMADD